MPPPVSLLVHRFNIHFQWFCITITVRSTGQHLFMATNSTTQTDYLLGYAFISIGIHLLTHDNIIANNVIILWSPILVIDLTTCYNVISALLHHRTPCRVDRAVMYCTVLYCVLCCALCLYHFSKYFATYAMCLTYSFMTTII